MCPSVHPLSISASESLMASPVWILVLLLGAVDQGCASASVGPEPSTQKSPDWELVAPSSRDNSILSQCDFEDDSKPFCDWSQVSADDGDWIRTSGLAPTGTSGPPGGYPNGEGHYLHMEPGSFPRGGVARLLSPVLWEAGPLCLRFAYHVFGLSWGTQLRLLLLPGTQNARPTVLWKLENTESPSWMPTAVTIPVELSPPSQLVFEGVRGSTAYLDISLDALSIRRGTCNQVCVMQTCSFDTLDDLCGWSWVPTASGAKWSQWKGPSGQPGIGPDDDFSSPGSGYYMLLDPKNAKPGQRSVLLSPLSHSTGCLTLSFHYILWAQAPGAALLVYGSVSGSIRKHTLFSGEPRATWHPVSVNYTGQGQIEFSLVGVFGEIPEPAVAVDEISIAPCGETFPQCDFEDSTHPFCDWTRGSEDSGQWARGSENMSANVVGPFGEALYGGEHYIYLETDRSSREGQSSRLVSRPFCAPGNVCVEFSYHMYGLGDGAALRLLLGSPAGSTPTLLWELIGSQKPHWLNASVTIPSGHQQPMQLILEAIQGSNAAFVVAVGFILISQGTCRAPVPAAVLPTTFPTEEPVVSTEKPAIPIEGPTVPTEQTTVCNEKLSVCTEKPTVAVEETTVPPKETTLHLAEITIPADNIPASSEEPAVLTEVTIITTEGPTIPTKEPAVRIEQPTILIENTTPPTEETTVPTEEPSTPTEETTVPTEEPSTPTEETTVPTENPSTSTEETSVPTEKPIIPTKKPKVCPPSCPSSTLPPTVPTAMAMPPETPNASMTNMAPATTRNPLPVSCPSDAHYEPCACPASCESPKPSCGLLCQPGCVCNPGFLLSASQCINASSCNCIYGDKSYKPGEKWFSPNCTKRCSCWPGSRMECQPSQCGTHTVCQLKNAQYGCHPYGTATCLVYGDPHYVTFDERHIAFTGKCTYILAQPCHNSTEPFFRVTAKNEYRGQEGVSCLSKVYITLSKTTVTLLKGRRIMVGDQRVTLPAMPAKGVFVSPSGRFVELQTAFGLHVRWDGEQQLFVTVSSTYAGKLCGFCGNYDGDSSNDNLKPNGNPAQDDEELGNSWQVAEDEDQECLQNEEDLPTCDAVLKRTISGPRFCGGLVDSRGPFEACLLHMKASPFFDNCMLDLCRFQGLRAMLCAHLSAMTAACQDAGYPVKPWRGPQFCPLACPRNSRYSLCASPCPNTCHPAFSSKPCVGPCVEACECNPGFVLSDLECVPWTQCGCRSSSGHYFKLGERWYKPGCKELCVCQRKRIYCRPWKCRAQEACGHQNGRYGCYAQGSATCTALGDPHYLTFDGALHHFLGTCTYTLTQPCWSRYPENHFVVSATNEIRGGNLEAAYVKAVHVHVLDLKISLIKGRRVMLNGHLVALPVWLSQGRVTVRLSGSFILLYTNTGLQVRYDGNHLVEVTVPSSYAGQLCGLCGNYNNNSMDDNLRPDRKPADSSSQLGAAWTSSQDSEPGCFLVGAEPSSCPEDDDRVDAWSKNCEILMNPLGPFSNCHQLVQPQASFTSCVQGQCDTQGDSLALCRSLQAYASLCALAGQAPAWRNSTFCPPRCPPNSSYSPCARPCPATCLSMSTPEDCPAALPCTEGCECQKGYVLSGTSCVPLSQCGCLEPQGFYHPVGESWYPERTCTSRCTCFVHNNITCRQAACQEDEVCWLHDGLLSCWAPGAGVCRASGDSEYVAFDGSTHLVQDTCPHILVKVCHPNMDLPVFKISAKSEGRAGAFGLRQAYIDVADARVTLQEGHLVLINGTLVTLPATSQITGLSITSSSIYTIAHLQPGVQVKFDGRHFLEIKIPMAYYGKVCGVCGDFDGEEEEDDLLMPNDEPAQDDHEFMDSWKDKDTDSDCQEEHEQGEQTLNTDCRPADLETAQGHCRAALRTPAWAKCAARVALEPFLLDCAHKLCEFGGLSQVLCEALQAFGAACQSQGIRVPLWRNTSFCPLECPAHSSYTSCTPSCPPSCWDLDGHCEGVKVPSTCTEGCVCQLGYVLNEDKCVPRSQCGCKDAQGGFIPAGKTWISSSCTQSCTCSEGSVQCRAFHCPPGSHCQDNEDGDTNCAPNRSQHCSVFGDPHYRTFDGRSYHFQGRMTYILVKTVDVLPDGMQHLVVEGRNKIYSPMSQVFLHEVITTIYGYKVQFQKDLVLLVNSQKMAVPYRPNEHLRVTLRGQRLYLITDFELVISFDGSSTVISLPSMYQRLVRGLCGNYDSDRRNDFMLPNGALTHSISIFGRSWEVKHKDALLHFRRALQEEEEEEDSRSQAGSRCSPEQLALINGTQACGVLGDPRGLFAACHHTVAPEPFQEHCVMDLCTTRDPTEQEELRCRILSGYAILCQEAGASLAGWRDHTRCAMACPANTVYQSCMTPCPASCANLLAPGECEGPCVEGCASLPGYTYSSTQSLPLANCGCTTNGVYYQLGDSFVVEDCSLRCTCARPQVLLCKPFSCSAGEICTLANLTRGCFRESPCLQNPCQNDGRCQEQGSGFTCECELGYGGDLCTEPQNVPPPRKKAPSLVAILLTLLMPVTVLVHVLRRECMCRARKRRRRGKRREKMKGQTEPGAQLLSPDTVPEPAAKSLF
ncbi:PREDICTED: zonadhesin isoform X1 [Chinchilla lanigera]|uniref:zonadhesin isoform X1 n=1 Tax=Chinchilla lanigera TaxID=34839 RepID=UPI000697D759|nr:PREDICTED: zonadhesin isoform X1 [Chinchilla lanigera]